MKVSASARCRAAAAKAVAAVFSGKNLDTALAQVQREVLPDDLGLLRMLAFEVLRHHAHYSALAGRLLNKPLPPYDPLHALILVGLHQLAATRIPSHAAINETVSAVPAIGKPKTRGLVNATLRRFQRERSELEALISAKLPVRLSYPKWLVDQLRGDWGEALEEVLAAGNEAGPMSLRVNTQRQSVVDYAARLAEAGRPCRPIFGAPQALQLDEACAVELLPGFDEGDCSVQDASAQLAADLIGPLAADARVLDACAAPGGKAAHLLERHPGLKLLALDSDANRSQRISETLLRLKLQADLQTADAGNPGDWWDKQFFDAILLDAPCSGTGVIRRHPDIKWLRRESDIKTLAAGQLRLLKGLWPTLKPGGTLLYATCSILQAEGDAVIQQFLRTQGDAHVQTIEASWGQATAHGRRIAPGGSWDGFYYARLSKAED